LVGAIHSNNEASLTVCVTAYVRYAATDLASWVDGIWYPDSVLIGRQIKEFTHPASGSPTISVIPNSLGRDARLTADESSAAACENVRTRRGKIYIRAVLARVVGIGRSVITCSDRDGNPHRCTVGTSAVKITLGLIGPTRLG